MVEHAGSILPPNIPLPKIGASRSVSGTPSRRERKAVGVTNRPSTVPSSQGSQRRPTPQYDDTRNDERDAPIRGTMASGDQEHNSFRRNVREKILMRRLNVGPYLREPSVNGYISSTQMREVLKKMHLGLNDKEMAFCCGAEEGQPDDFVDVTNFLHSLRVPDFDGYDPMGKSKLRETAFLRRTAAASRKRREELWSAQNTGNMPEKETSPCPPAENDERKSTAGSRLSSAGSMGFDGPNMRQARKHARQLSEKMKENGMTILEMFRKIDKDGSGIIEKSEFESELQKRGSLGMMQQQIDSVWKFIDKDGSNSINYLELLAAMETESTPRSRRTTSSASSRSKMDGGGGGLTFGDPWAQSKGKRQPILPSDNFNVRTWRGQPARSTSDLVVPIRESFLHCPDWQQYHAVTLNNCWLMDGTGEGKIKKVRQEAKLERKRQNEARIKESVARREQQSDDLDAARLSGLCKTRLQWMSMLKGPWA
mmetsp:Transcript_68576/g.143005  ORF Transcript_68576/g.143005 Transcript_68576/m.143005 type:complete len:482 (+) Transcript_68576:180-1625(+)